MQHEVSSTVTPSTGTVLQAYTGPDFYDVPDPLPDAAHGTLIRFERSSNRAVPGTTAYRIMYLSESLTGNRVAVTGMATVPTATPGGDGRSVVSLGHGTSGIADRCAPSKYPAVPELTAAQAGLGQEALIAQTDYEGLGTPGRHPYLVGQSEGRSMLDAAIAAGQLPNAHPGTDLAVAGYSQGGQAALWAAQLAASWTPQLAASWTPQFHLVGTFAGAPASETDLTLAAAPALPSAAYTYLLVAGYAAAYPEADPNLILTEQGVRSLDTVDFAAASSRRSDSMSGGVISRRNEVLLGSSASSMGLRVMVRFRRAHLNVPLSRVKVWWIELWLCPSARMAPSARSMSSGKDSVGDLVAQERGDLAVGEASVADHGRVAPAFVVLEVGEVAVEELADRDALLGAVGDVPAVSDFGYEFGKGAGRFLLGAGHAPEHSFWEAVGTDAG